MSIKCDFCQKEFSTNYARKYHEKTAKYCLRARNVSAETEFGCDLCNKNFTTLQNLQYHAKRCGSELQWKSKEELINEIQLSKTKIQMLETHILKYEAQVLDLQKKLENVAIKGATKSTNTNILNNNTVNLLPLSDDYLQDYSKTFRVEDMESVDAFANFAINGLRNHMYCSDYSRRIFRVKNIDGEIYTDPNGKKTMAKLCENIKNTARNHYMIIIERAKKKPEGDTELVLESAEVKSFITETAKGNEHKFTAKITRKLAETFGDIKRLEIEEVSDQTMRDDLSNSDTESERIVYITNDSEDDD
jgi:hypothetical protein